MGACSDKHIDLMEKNVGTEIKKTPCRRPPLQPYRNLALTITIGEKKGE